jgi:hypothetical protein
MNNNNNNHNNNDNHNNEVANNSWQTQKPVIKLEIYRKSPITLEDFPTADEIVRLAEENGLRGQFVVYVDNKLISSPDDFPASGTHIKIVPDDVWG